MQLIAGLGNPGSRYSNTPHNLGFEVVDVLASRWGIAWKTVTRWRAEVARQIGGDAPVNLVKPLTFMNLSGEAIAPIAAFYNIEPQNVLVVVDDVHLPIGRLRLRVDGTDGGHNGLKSIIRQLGTTQFPRLRLGCAPPEGEIRNRIHFVLGRMGREERAWMDRMVEAAADAVEAILKNDLEKAMTLYNGLDIPYPGDEKPRTPQGGSPA